MADQPFTFSYAEMPLDGVDEFGCRWKTLDEDGWFSGAPAKNASSEGRSGQDGDWPSQPLRDARTVTLSGTVSSDAGIGPLERAVRAYGAAPLVGVLSGASAELGTLTAVGEVQGDPKVKIIHSRKATWMLTVKLPDPLLYGPDTFGSAGLSGVAGTGRVWPRAWPRDWGVPAGVTPGAVSVPNAGRAAYWPRMRIDGPVANPVITCNETGDSLRYAGTLAAGQYLDIDCGVRRVLLNGFTSQAGRCTWSGRGLGVPVGGASFSWAADSSNPAATLSIFAREGAWL